MITFAAKAFSICEVKASILLVGSRSLMQEEVPELGQLLLRKLELCNDFGALDVSLGGSIELIVTVDDVIRSKNFLLGHWELLQEDCHCLLQCEIPL